MGIGKLLSQTKLKSPLYDPWVLHAISLYIDQVNANGVILSKVWPEEVIAEIEKNKLAFDTKYDGLAATWAPLKSVMETFHIGQVSLIRYIGSWSILNLYLKDIKNGHKYNGAGAFKSKMGEGESFIPLIPECYIFLEDVDIDYDLKVNLCFLSMGLVIMREVDRRSNKDAKLVISFYERSKR